MGLFGKKTYSLDDLSGFNTHVLKDCLELVINSGIGDQYKSLYASVNKGTLTKSEMQECRSFAQWYKDLVVSQPQLAQSFGEANYKATINALAEIESYAAKKLR